MFNGYIRDKSLEGVLDNLDYIAENEQHLDTIDTYELLSKPKPYLSSEGMYNLREDYNVQAKFASLARKVEALDSNKGDHVMSVQDILYHVCSSTDHIM